MFLDFITILPELYFINFIILFFWYGLYTRHKNVLWNYSDVSIYYFLFLIFLCCVLLINSPITSSVSFNSSFKITDFAVILKVMTLLIFFIFNLSLLNFDLNTPENNKTNIEVFSIRAVLVFSLLLLASTEDLVLLWLAFEVYSISTYILVACKSEENNILNTEAAIKYFILGTIFSIIMLYSIGLLYFLTGLTNLDSLELYFSIFSNSGFYLFDIDFCAMAITLLLISFLFKIAAAPFHFWAPDVYEGAGITTTHFLFVVPKIILFGVIIKLSFLWEIFPITILLGIAIFISFIVGSVGGLFSKKLKRLLTYSTINNTGYFLLAVLANSHFSFVTLFVFLIVYSVSTVGLFTLLQNIRIFPYLNNIKNIWGLSNIFYINKTKAFALGFLLFSSAAIPPMVGFVLKFFILLSVIVNTNTLIILIIFSLLLSAISCFYYIRLVKIMSFSKRKSYFFSKAPSAAPAYLISVVVIFLLILFICSGLLLNGLLFLI